MPRQWRITGRARADIDGMLRLTALRFGERQADIYATLVERTCPGRRRTRPARGAAA